MKKLKRIFSLFLILTIGILGITLSPKVKANTDGMVGQILAEIVTPGNEDTMRTYTLEELFGESVVLRFDIHIYHDYDSTKSGGEYLMHSFTFDNVYEYETLSIWFSTGQNTSFELEMYGYAEMKFYDGHTTIGFGGGRDERVVATLTNIVEVEEDNLRPAISGEENFVTNVDDAKPVSFFQAYITAVDETDGVVPVYVVTDNYTANKSVLGSHKVVFGAKDSSNNEATLEVYIRVVDITNPIITGNSSVAKIGYKETYNISNFKTTLTVSDNYDTLTHNDITVKSDGYTSNKAKLGTYNVVYAVLDSSGNEGTFTKQIQVYDNVKPNISGPSTIATSNNTLLTEADIRAQLTAQDEIDGNITNKIELVEDNYTGNGNKVGTYTIIYRVTDNAGNTDTKTVTITRSDKIPPVFLIEDNVTIKTTPTTPLDFNQIIQILEATGQVQVNSTTTFSTIFEDYTGNEDVPGTYTWGVKARSTDGNSSETFMTISVLDTEDDEGVEVNPDFKIMEWIKENPVLFAVSLFAVIAVIGIIFRKKRK